MKIGSIIIIAIIAFIVVQNPGVVSQLFHAIVNLITALVHAISVLLNAVAHEASKV